MSESPYAVQLNDPSAELIQQQLITYKKVDGRVVKVTTTRHFHPNDYTDSQSTEILDV
jgi:hypothetical protein